jgi:hypothetical protein
MKTWYYFMISPTIEIVSYTSIICIILVYDTLHYDQPKSVHRTQKTFIVYNAIDWLHALEALPRRNWGVRITSCERYECCTPCEALDGSDAPPRKNHGGWRKEWSYHAHPAYGDWLTQDQQAVSYLLNSMSKDVLTQVIGLEHANNIWVVVVVLVQGFYAAPNPKTHTKNDFTNISMSIFTFWNVNIQQFGYLLPHSTPSPTHLFQITRAILTKKRVHDAL